MRIRTVGRLVSALALVLALAAPAAAQGTAGPGTGTTGVVLGAGLSFLNVDAIDSGSNDTFMGFTVDFRKNVASTGNVDLGVVGDFAWHRKNFTEDDFDEDFDISVDFSLLSFMGGFRATASQLNRVAPFGQVLFGGVRPSLGGDLSCDDEEDACTTEFAIAFGGGVDVGLTENLNFRGQLDFFRVFTEGEATNAVRFVFGISTRLGGS